MANIESTFFDIGTLDTLARGGGSAVHRLDPRAKLIATLVFSAVVVSFGKYEVSALLPFFLFPVVLGTLAQLPAGYLAGKLLMAAPFALLVGAFNPLLDREILLHLGPVGVSGGWVSFASVLLRFALTVVAALVLVATTGFAPICLALERLGLPRILVQQLLFLHRYLFVLVDEASRLSRARSLRSFGGRGMGMGAFASMVGQLLLRTMDRAHRIHRAMLGRGFDGEIRLMRPLRPLRFRRRDLLFTLGCSAAFLALRFCNLPRLLGGIVTELIR